MLEESGSAFLPDHDADAFSVFEEFTRGDAAAHRSIDRFCDALAFGLASAACAIDPHLILIGGGVSESFDLFSEELRRDFKRYAIPPCKNTPIEKARLGNDAGFMGAARFAWMHLLHSTDPTREDVSP